MGSAEKRALGKRLERVRTGMDVGREEMAAHLGVKLRAYTNYLAGISSPDADGIGFVVGEGWNANWLLTGEGPELLSELQVAEDPAGYGSQDLSEEQLTIALEITDDIIREEGARYVPRILYARLLRLMYQGVARGLPMAEIHDFGCRAVRAAISGTGDEVGDVGQQGVDKSGQGGRR